MRFRLRSAAGLIGLVAVLLFGATLPGRWGRLRSLAEAYHSRELQTLQAKREAEHEAACSRAAQEQLVEGCADWLHHREMARRLASRASELGRLASEQAEIKRQIECRWW